MKKYFISAITVFMIFTSASGAFASEPSWYPDNVNSFEDFHTSETERVVDDADIFTDSEEAALEEQIQTLIGDYDKDFVIYTTDSSYYRDADELAMEFYVYSGYGVGDDYSGSVMLILMEEGNRQWYSAGTGDAEQYYTYKNIEDMNDAIDSDMRSGEYYLAMVKYIDCLDVLYGHKVSASVMGFIVLAALVVAGAVAAILLFVFYRGMKKVRIATEANRYVIPGSFKIRKSNDYFLYSNRVRVRRSDGDGKSGGSGFSSGSIGGRSFSGGGRKF